jgi:hypothetical protein
VHFAGAALDSFHEFAPMLVVSGGGSAASSWSKPVVRLNVPFRHVPRSMRFLRVFRCFIGDTCAVFSAGQTATVVVRYAGLRGKPVSKPTTIRRHAILKHPYRRAVRSTPDFHSLPAAAQWAVLRAEVGSDTTAAGASLLEVLNSREPRRDEVLAALEGGRQADARARAQG